jgi:tetratricopeptide (TPR) repeat protein
MTTSKVGDRINDLIEAEQWKDARALIQKTLKREPRNHWLLTQLGETYYEQQDYKKALEVLLRSRGILPDCPLTLWHLAGTLDALRHHAEAIQLYTWLLRSTKTPEDDPCWESVEWTDALKTDCVFRMGLCFKHLDRNERAAYCFRKYIDVLSQGAEGSYPIEEARKYLQESLPSEREAVEQELQEVAEWTRQEFGEDVMPSIKPPALDLQTLQHLQEA